MSTKLGMRELDLSVGGLPPGVAVLVGPPGTVKTTTAMTWPGKVMIYDFDLGAQRAWKVRELMAQGVVKVKQVPIPEKSITTRYQRMEGFRDIWREFTKDFFETCENPEYRTIVIDTMTYEWSLCCDAYLEELQDAQLEREPNKKDIRRQLTQMEFREPNARQSTLFSTARGYGKWLIMVAHEADDYAVLKDPEGREVKDEDGRPVSVVVGSKPDGFKRTVGMSDWVFWFRTEQKDGEVPVPFAKISKSGWGIDLVGVEMEQPSLKMLEDRLVQLGRL